MAYLPQEDFELTIGSVVWHKADRRRMIVVEEGIDINEAGEVIKADGGEVDIIRRKCECSCALSGGGDEEYAIGTFYYAELATVRFSLKDDDFKNGGSEPDLPYEMTL